MLPLRYAAILAVGVLVTCLWLTARDVGYAVAPLQERLAARCEDFGLYGYAIVLRLRAAEGYAAESGQEGKVAAAGCLERAARLLHQYAGPAAATHALHRAIGLDPSRTDLQVELLQRRVAAGEKSAAEELFSLAFSSENPDALRVVAEDYRAQGRTADALGCLCHAAEKAPQRHAIRLSLARLYRLTGDVEKAKVQARAARELAATPEQRTAARSLLRELGEPLPTAEEDLWQQRYDKYALPAAVLLGFLLVVFSPCLLQRMRGVSGALRRGSSVPATAEPSAAE